MQGDLGWRKLEESIEYAAEVWWTEDIVHAGNWVGTNES